MVLIVGIATTAAGAIIWYRKVMEEAFGDPLVILRRVRQTTGVVLAVAHFIRSALDALQLVNRQVAPATAGAGLRPTIGVRAGDAD